MQIWARCLLILVTLGILPSCQKSYHEENETYYLVGMNLENPYWQEVQRGFKSGVSSLGFEVNWEVVGPPVYDVEEQLQAFRGAVARRPAGILVSPGIADAFTEPINQAIEQGIPVICINSDAPDSRRITFIGTDNYEAGLQGGELALQLLDAKLKNRRIRRVNVILLTIPGQLNLDERVRGYREALGRNRKINFMAVLDDEGQVQKAYDAITALLVQEGEPIDAIIAVEASGGQGAADSLYTIDMHGKIPIIAMDKNPLTLDWIERGGIAATISQKPYTMGFYGVKLLDDLHHNAVLQFTDWRTAPVYPVPSNVDTGTAIVNKENLQAFRDALPPPPGPLSM